MSQSPLDADDDRDAVSTSRSLLAEAQQLDPEAWERLVRRYTPLVAFWCRRWHVPEQDLADVLQDVFAAVAVHLPRFHRDQPCDTFRGWLSTIARHKVSDHFRRRGREPDAAGGTEFTRRLQDVPALAIPVSATDSDRRPGHPDNDEPVSDELLRHVLHAIQHEFQERTWLAFWGTVIDGRAAADVADDLGMKPGAVRVAKSRVLLRLRRELADSSG